MGLGLDLIRSHSPGATGAHLLTQMGVRRPLERPLIERELSAWTRSLHGGWVTSGPLDGVAFPAIDADISNAYSAVASLVGWWSYMTADRLVVGDVTQAFRRFLSAPDLRERMYRKATWRRWGLTRVVLRLRGEPVAVEIVEDTGSRLHLLPTWGDELDATWLDAVGATHLAGYPIEVLQAVRIAPRGCQSGLRAVRIPGGLLRPEDDPVVPLVRLRRWAKTVGDHRLAALLRVLLNAIVYGNAARFDPDGDGERPGPWCFPPLAATVAAGARCLLAMAETEVHALGGVIAARDTDGVLFPASPDGGTIRSASGDPARILSWSEASGLLAHFDRLDPFGDGEPFWSIDREASGHPLWAVVWGRKRNGQFLPADNCRVASSTEHVLGAYSAPPSVPGRRPDGRHRWTEGVVRVHAGSPLANPPKSSLHSIGKPRTSTSRRSSRCPSPFPRRSPRCRGLSACGPSPG